MTTKNSYKIRKSFLSVIVQIAFWFLIFLNSVLAFACIEETYSMWFGWGNDNPIGWEGGGWMYATKINYALSMLINLLFLIACILASLQSKNRLFAMPLLIVTPIGLMIINSALSGNLDSVWEHFQ